MEPQLTSQLPVQQPAPPQTQWYLATVLRRWAALIIDRLLWIAISFPIIIAIENSRLKDTWPAILIFIIISVCYYFYAVLLTYKYGATLGKRWLQIKVVKANGQPVTLTQALLRETVGRYLSGLVLNLGYFWALWDKNRQTWHDKIAGTYVVTPIPNNGKSSTWLIVLIISFVLIIPIIAILAAVVLIAVNPLGARQKAQAQDSRRMFDLQEVNSAISLARSQNPMLKLCPAGQTYCEGLSNEPGAQAVDGTGWVKVNLSKTGTMPALPIDPAANSSTTTHYYRYCSDGKNWEIDAKLVSPQNQQKMANDGGDNPTAYEVGSKLTVCR